MVQSQVMVLTEALLLGCCGCLNGTQSCILVSQVSNCLDLVFDFLIPSTGHSFGLFLVWVCILLQHGAMEWRHGCPWFVRFGCLLAGQDICLFLPVHGRWHLRWTQALIELALVELAMVILALVRLDLVLWMLDLDDEVLLIHPMRRWKILHNGPKLALAVLHVLWGAFADVSSLDLSLASPMRISRLVLLGVALYQLLLLIYICELERLCVHANMRRLSFERL